jgi:predicted DNA-binding transcriptional regulator AlpA
MLINTQQSSTPKPAAFLSACLLRYKDLIALGIVNNRMTLRRWMDRKDDPFPPPIVLTASARQNHSIAWKAAAVEAWLERRANAAAPEGASLDDIATRTPKP